MMRFKKSILFITILLFSVIYFACSSARSIKSIDDLSMSEVSLKISNDISAVLNYEKGLKTTLEFAKANKNIFPKEKKNDVKMLTLHEKESLLGIWQSMLDYSIALESVIQYHKYYFKLKDKENRKASFHVLYSAFLTQYRYLLEFIYMAEKNPVIDVILNEENNEYGVRKDSYTGYKYEILNVAIATEFVALNTIYETWADKHNSALDKTISDNSDHIFKMGKGQGEKFTLENALKVFKKSSIKSVFPVQAGISEWMGDTKIWRVASFLITQDQIREIIPELKPGDILLERREWYLSNVGLPGYWPHAALYIGTPEERAVFFDHEDDEEFANWLKSFGSGIRSFDDLIKGQFPEKYAESARPLEENHMPRIIEAMSEGVIFTTIEHSAACDSFAVLRPILSKKEIGRAILRAFMYQGRPYDFNFDFLTDNEIVCTELIYKIYQPTREYKGLNIPVIKVVGRLATPANEIVKHFDKTYDTEDRQMDFVLFYDGFEKRKKAELSGIDSFRESWKRSKWHIFTQE